MRNRRSRRQKLFARVSSASGTLVAGARSRIARRPVDSVAILAAAGASLIVIVNAIFLQSGAHPAPFVDSWKSSDSRNDRLKITIADGPTRPATVSGASASAAARRNDPSADLIGPSPRIAAVQRALSAYGYGQVKASGNLDDATTAAIEKFEREHNLPITGRVSDRLVSELAAMIGHPIE